MARKLNSSGNVVSKRGNLTRKQCKKINDDFVRKIAERNFPALKEHLFETILSELGHPTIANPCYTGKDMTVELDFNRPKSKFGQRLDEAVKRSEEAKNNKA